MHGIRALASVDVIATGRLGEVDPRLESLFLGLDVIDEDVRGMPAGGEAQAIPGELRLQHAALVGHLMTLLDAVETDLAAVPEAVLERQMISDRPVIIVRPGDGVGSIKDHGRDLPSLVAIGLSVPPGRVPRRSASVEHALPAAFSS